MESSLFNASILVCKEPKERDNSGKEVRDSRRDENEESIYTRHGGCNTHSYSVDRGLYESNCIVDGEA